MKLAPEKRKELASATIVPTLGLTLACCGLFILTAYASQPSWWNSEGAVLQQVVTTNDGVVTTNYEANNYMVADQGQLKLFTEKAVAYLNANLTNNGGAGPALTNLVYGWQQDYLTNGYATNTANPSYPYKPSDYAAVNLGQLKYIASLVDGQLASAGYTGLTPSWLTPNSNSDYMAANLGQLKTVFNFDLTATPQPVLDVVATDVSSTEVDLTWADPINNNATAILIQQQNADGTWTTVATLGPTATSYDDTNVTAGSDPNLQVITENSFSSSSGTSAQNRKNNPTQRYVVIDLGPNFIPVGINSSGMVAGNNPNGVSSGVFWNGSAEVWSQGTVSPLTNSLIGSGSAYAINDSGAVSGSARFNFTWQTGSNPNTFVTTNEMHACFWPSISSPPTDLDSVSNSIHISDGPSTTFYSSFGTAISKSGTVYGYFHINGAQDAVQFSAGAAPTRVNPTWDPNYEPARTPATIGATMRSAAGSHSCGDYNFLTPVPYTNGFIIDGTLIPVPSSFSRTSSCYAYAINTNGVAVGSLGTNCVSFSNGSIDTILLTGPGAPSALNNLANSQVVGNDGSGNANLWDYTYYDGESLFYPVPKNLNKIIPPNTGWQLQTATGINDAGEIVGSGSLTMGTNAPAVHGYFLSPSQFQLRAVADVFNGWDDTGASPSGSGSGYSPNPDMNPTWISMATGTTNSRVKLMIPDYSNLQNLGLQLVVPQDGSQNTISLTNSTISRVETDFNIIATNTPNNASIQLQTGSGQVLLTLMVHVMTPQTVKVDVYDVWDNTSANTIFSTNLPPSPQAIVSELNTVYGNQAQVNFVLDATPAPKNIRYDLNNNGSFDFNSGVVTPTREQAAIFPNPPVVGPLQIAIVNTLHDANPDPVEVGTTLGTTAGLDNGLSYCIVAANAPLLAYAHEVGHALGLSTVNYEGSAHDGGPWPPEFGTDGGSSSQVGLMYPSANNSTIWIRQQDWTYANTNGAPNYP